MKATEVITRLQRMVEQLGDKDVFIGTPTGDEYKSTGVVVSRFEGDFVIEGEE